LFLIAGGRLPAAADCRRRPIAGSGQLPVGVEI